MLRHTYRVDTLLSRVTAHYVHPDRTAAITGHVRARHLAGAYEHLDGPELAEALTADLRAVHPDRHLSAVWLAEPRSGPADAAAAALRAEDEWRERSRLEAEGVRRVERLPGNVGVIEFTGFGDPGRTGPAYEAAMRLVAGTYALIIDLRANRGGWPESAAQVCGYLHDGEPVHIGDVLGGAESTPRQRWTPEYLPGPRYTGRPVYVLTSAKTFSGGEDLAYSLQSLGRATIVGETTAGAAQAFEVYPVDERMDAYVPNVRTVDARTGGDWEGTGVEPDVACAAEAALEVAYRECLRYTNGLDLGSSDPNERRIAGEVAEALAGTSAGAEAEPPAA